KDFGDKISADERKRVEEAISKLRGVLNSEDREKIKSEFENLQRVWAEVASRVYASTSGGTQQQTTQSSSSSSKKEDKGDKGEGTDYEVIS
ncbi:hypothetical protein DRJ22_05935, partial [Candidatus Woesearchaeota archaeon]